MRPLVHSATTPRTVDAFEIDWSGAVVAVASVPEARHGYLEAIARYSNDEGGIFALELLLAEDPRLDRLLAQVHGLPHVQPELVPRLLARTSAAAALSAFSTDAAALEQALRARSFAWRDPFVLAGELARYLYDYGMVERFHDHHPAARALALAQALVRDAAGDALEDIVALDARGPWGAWFDPHSCTDRSFVLIDRRRRIATLLCFSHSD